MTPLNPDANTGLEATPGPGAKTFFGPIVERVLSPTAELLGEGLKGGLRKDGRTSLESSAGLMIV